MKWETFYTTKKKEKAKIYTYSLKHIQLIVHDSCIDEYYYFILFSCHIYLSFILENISGVKVKTQKQFGNEYSEALVKYVKYY